MLPSSPIFGLGAIAAAVASAVPSRANPIATDATVQRLDCGTGDVPRAFYSTALTPPPAGVIHGVVSCYLVRHGRDLLLWDAGLSPRYMSQDTAGRAPGFHLSTLLTTQLRARGIDPRQVRLLAISHLHFDHVGQAASFPQATLLADEHDLATLKSGKLPMGVDADSLRPWASGHGTSQPVHGDYDVFGDGSVILLATPGHTEGHHALLVRRKGKPPLILAGDLWHAGFQMSDNAVSQHTEDPAALLRSRARILKLARETHAVIVIGHDPSLANVD